VRKIIAVSGLLGGFLAVALFACPVAQAMPPAIPPAIALNCGKDVTDAGNYNACVTVVNETLGFAAPGVVSHSAGLAFTADGEAEYFGPPSLGRTARWVLGSAGQPTQSFLEPGKGWVAYSCRRAWPDTAGCRAQVTTTVAQPDNANVKSPAIQAAVLKEDTTPTNRASGQVEYYTKPLESLYSCENQSKYVNCLKLRAQSPHRDYARYDFELRNFPMAINVTNFLPQRLVLNKNVVDWNGVIPDSRGETPTQTLASGQQNSARSIAPYVDGFEPPDANWGGLRPMTRSGSEIQMTYDVTGPGEYQGVKVRVHMQPKSGGWNTEDACKLTGPGTNLPKCEATITEPNGQVRLEVTISSFAG